MTEIDLCSLCAMQPKTIMHTLRNCVFTTTIWKSVILSQLQSQFFSLSFHDWLSWNLHDKGYLNKADLDWQTLFVIVCWFIWKSRNEVVFSASHRSTQAIVDMSFACARSYFDYAPKLKLASGRDMFSRWKAPTFG